MPEIVTKPNANALQVLIADTVKSSGLDLKIAQLAKFDAKYKQIYLDLPANKLYVGTDYKIEHKTTDPFAGVQWYELGATIARSLAGSKVVDIELNCKVDLNQDNLQRLLLGIFQASWHYDSYLSKQAAKSKSYKVYLADSITKNFDTNTLKLVRQEVSALDAAMLLTRTLVNEPPETLHPHTAAKLVLENFKRVAGVKVSIYDEKWLSAQGMNGITFVGRGSRYQPRLVHVVLKAKAKAKQKIVLVGKGLTYDSGGLDIKIAGNMKTMKMDMAGAATMFGVMKAISELGLNNIELHWLSAFAENMIGPNSYKADDIIETYSGQTVEVHNTDAEGRLTLADVLSYATTLDPDYIIDAATLTGAAINAISERFTALMGNDQRLINDLLNQFEAEGEYTVHTPMPESLREVVKGEISDLINTATIERQAGHISAGLFLSHFVNQKNFRNSKLKMKKPIEPAWVHLDIAGSAYNNGKNGLEAKGATGQSVRSIVAWLLSLDK